MMLLQMGLAAVLGFVLTVVFGRYLLPLLRRLKAGQSIKEDGPNWHMMKQGTPTMGGFMFMVASLVTVLVVQWKSILAGDLTAVFLLLFAWVFGIIGFVDDYAKVKKKENTGLTAAQKFLLQLAASILFLILLRNVGLLSPNLYIPFFGIEWKLNWISYMIFCALVMVGTVNAVNITDGVDGLATGVTLPVCAFFVMLGVYGVQVWERSESLGVVVFAASLFGALFGFLRYNFNPAKVFMGDTGSLFLGGAVCAMAFAMDVPVVLAVVGLIYVLEALSVILQVGYFKLTHGKRIFRMAPLHHHFELGGWSEKKLFFVFTGITCVCCILAYFGVIHRYP